MNLEALEEAPLNNAWNVQQDLEILWGTSIRIQGLWLIISDMCTWARGGVDWEGRKRWGE